MSTEKKHSHHLKARLTCLGVIAILTAIPLIGIFSGLYSVDLGFARFETHRGYAMAGDDLADRIPDEKLSDHKPPFEPAFTELMATPMGDEMYVNRSSAVISLDIVTDSEDDDSQLAGRLYPTFAAAIASGLPVLPSLDMIDIYTKQTDDELVAALETHLHDGGGVFPGGKQGLLRAIIDEIRSGEMDEAADEAVAFLAAAVILGGDELQLSPELMSLAEKNRQKFLVNPFNAKPIGLYTRTDTLKQVFKRDRLLQQPFASVEFTGYAEDGTGAHNYPDRSLAAAIRIAEALDRRPELLAAYETCLEFGHRLTNPDANLNLADLLSYKEYFDDPGRLVTELKYSPAMAEVMRSWFIGTGKVGIAVWPFATSRENQLMSRIYPDMDPDGDIMTDLIAAIRTGRLNLAPEGNSGWYDYQTHAMETLLLPERAREADKLLLMSRYKVRLRRAFEAMITQRRETQVKSLATYSADNREAIPRLDPKPLVTIEPQPTSYLRTARGYRMLEDALTGLLGKEDLAAAMIAGSEASAIDRIREARAVFTALYLLSCNEIGMAPELEPGEVADVDFSVVGKAQADPQASIVIDNLPELSPEEAEQYLEACTQGEVWAAGLAGSEYMGYDPRVIVPVCSSMDGTYSHYWAVVGVQLAELKFDYVIPPRTLQPKRWDDETRQYVDLTLDQANEELSSTIDRENYSWEPKRVFIPVCVFREVRLKPEPPTREEYRAVCDKCDTVDEIVKALEREFGP